MEKNNNKEMVSKTTRVACVQTFPASSKTGVSSVRVADLLLVRFCFLEWTLFKVFSVFCIIYVIWRPYQSRTPTLKKKKKKNGTVVNLWLPCLIMYMTKSKAGKAGPASQTEIQILLSPSAKQCRNPCSGPTPVYQDLSTRCDWPV